MESVFCRNHNFSFVKTCCHRKLTSQNIKLYFQSCYAKYLKCQPGILVYEPLVKCLILRWALSTSQYQLHSTILCLSRPIVLYLYITLKECSAFWTYKVVRCFLVQRETAISAHSLCGPYYHALVYNVILPAVLYFIVHIVVTCHLHLWQWPGSFTCYCGDMWWNKYQNKVSSPTTPARTWTHNHLFMSLVLYHWATPPYSPI